MKKIKITVQQENVLKEFNDIWKDKTANERYEIFLMSKKVTEIDADFLKPLTEIDSKDFFFMLHGRYEVETPKFKVGDWVYRSINGNKRYYKATKIVDADERTLSIYYVNQYKEDFKKVTEEWKIVLLELGREKPELKIGDKITTIQHYPLTITRKNMFAVDFKQVKYFYPVESRIEIKQ